MAEKVGYPIGQQDFKTLREDNCLYVDKTKFIEKIVSPPNRYYSLARPRRFGKSLFLSSLQYFFEGRKELFRGLYIDSNDREWEKYPVFRLDLNTEKYEVPGLLDSLFDNIFKKWEKEYGIKEIAETLSTRFQNIIEAAHEKTGHQVVILVNSLAEKRRISYEEACHLLKNHYYGYRFAEEGSDIYNPWSVLNAMQDRTISNYWGRSGKATIIAETLKNVDADLEGILSSIVPMRTL